MQQKTSETEFTEISSSERNRKKILTGIIGIVVLLVLVLKKRLTVRLTARTPMTDCGGGFMLSGGSNRCCYSMSYEPMIP